MRKVLFLSAALAAAAASMASAQSIGLGAASVDTGGNTYNGYQGSYAYETPAGPKSRFDAYLTASGFDVQGVSMRAYELGVTWAYGFSPQASGGFYLDYSYLDDNAYYADISSFGVELRSNLSKSAYLSGYAGTLFGGTLPSGVDVTGYGIRTGISITEGTNLDVAYQGEHYSDIGTQWATSATFSQILTPNAASPIYVEVSARRFEDDTGYTSDKYYLGFRFNQSEKRIPRSARTDHILFHPL